MSAGSIGRKGGLVAAGLGAPAFIGLMLFLIIPFLLAINLTLTNTKLISPQPAEFVGLSNYERLLGVNWMVQDPLPAAELGSPQNRYERIRDVTRSDPDYRGYRPLTTFELGEQRHVVLARDPVFIRSLMNTLLFAMMVVPLQCGLALGLALLVNAGLRGQTALRTVYFLPVVMSMVVVSVVWSFLYEKDIGFLNQLLSFFTFGFAGPVDWLGNSATALPAIVLMSAWQGAGFQMLIFLAGLQNISAALYDAAKIDGASRWQSFVHVTLPGLKTTTAFVVIVTTIAAFGLFTQVDVMTQGGPRNATSTVMFHAIDRGVRQQDISYGATITVVYFVIIAAISLLQQRYFNRDA